MSNSENVENVKDCEIDNDLVEITIDGKTVKTKEGEFILNVARANDIFIPAICYLTRCTPTLACRLCLVEADGKNVYGCNAKAKSGMEVKTVTDTIVDERRAIMEVYDVNHPLQCGVCDKSGECELQNYNQYMQVDEQHYSIRDTQREANVWGVMKYDPGLCIVCEKCVSVCKDVIGSNALKTRKRGGDALDKEFKKTMPKDAYAAWNKLQKSLIEYDESKCVDCGECISVCPVGAMVSSDFQYKSNAWELSKIPASNPHSSDCSLIYYEVKHTSIEDNKSQTIYRVTNDSHYVSLNGAARFGYDFENRVASKDEDAFNRTIEAFKKAKAIKFSSYITNEEALILQKLKEKFGYKLINDDAKAFQDFMNDFASTSGQSLYSGSLADIHSSNYVVSVGSYLKSDMPNARYAYNNAVSMNKGAGLYFHPLNDILINQVGKKGKTTEVVNNNPLSEEAILYLLLDMFGDDDLPQSTKDYLATFRETRTKTVTETIKEKVVEIVKDEETGEEKEVSKMVPKKVSNEVEYSYTKLLDMIGSDESLLEFIENSKSGKDRFSLVVGEDLITHPNSSNIAKLLGLLEKYSKFKIVIIPSKTNTLGVSLICDLDDNSSDLGYTIGYNAMGDFNMMAVEGKSQLDMPALNQQEGTFTNIDKKIVQTNPAIVYNGYELNDIANELGLNSKNVIDYTPELPVDKGYQIAQFDNLQNFYGNDRVEYRGYELKSFSIDANTEVQEINISDELDKNEVIIYSANPINQFSMFTNIAHEINDEMGIYASSEFFEKNEIMPGDRVVVSANGCDIELKAIVDVQLGSENICYIPDFDKSYGTARLFNNYRFNNASLKVTSKKSTSEEGEI
jgi:NADH-quinone oxidoreductase subunit G